MNDYMSLSDIQKEMDFWINYNQPPQDFKHKAFYVDFFDFAEISGDCLEIGCAGSPFVSYADKINPYLNLELLDPLMDEIVRIPKYSYLEKYTRHNTYLFDFRTWQSYDYIICLNVLDHFGQAHVNFLNKIFNLLKVGGYLYLYYDIRPKYLDGHYPIDHLAVHNHISNIYNICKESMDVNPVHNGWSGVRSSYRGVLQK